MWIAEILQPCVNIHKAVYLHINGLCYCIDRRSALPWKFTVLCRCTQPCKPWHSLSLYQREECQKDCGRNFRSAFLQHCSCWMTEAREAGQSPIFTLSHRKSIFKEEFYMVRQLLLTPLARSTGMLPIQKGLSYLHKRLLNVFFKKKTSASLGLGELQYFKIFFLWFHRAKKSLLDPGSVALCEQEITKC